MIMLLIIGVLALAGLGIAAQTTVGRREIWQRIPSWVFVVVCVLLIIVSIWSWTL
jgi:type VI protein secretion system component VasF